MLWTVRRKLLLLIAFAPLAWAAGCATEIAPLTQVPTRDDVQPFQGQPKVPPASAEAAHTPQGYSAQVVLDGLTYPSSIEFDDQGALFVAEAGQNMGDHFAPVRVLKLDPRGELSVHVEQGLEAPVTDLLWHEGALYVSHKGKISKVERGQVRDLVTDLPSEGDHPNGQLAAGPDGLIYFGQGTATNSGVVGPDNFVMGWLKVRPDVHDVLAEDVEVRESEYVSLNPLRLMHPDEEVMAETGGFEPFAGEDRPDVVRGQTKSNGSLLRFDPDRPEESLEVHAWGFRTPFGLTWTEDGRLFVADNGFDDRGSRPIANAPDVIWEVKQGAWYGWPDYAAGIPVTDERFKPEGKEQPEFLLAEHPPVEQPFLTLPPHTGVTKLEAIPAGAPFGHDGQLFLASYGDGAPLTGRTERPQGFAVYRIDPSQKAAEVFFHAKPQRDDGAPALAGPRRLMDVRLDPKGEALYVVDMGAMHVTDTVAPTLMPAEGTGVIWRIVRDDAAPIRRPPADLTIEASSKRRSR